MRMIRTTLNIGPTLLKEEEELLLADELLMHPFVEGEIACGSLRNRREILRLLGHLPRGRSPSTVRC